MDETPTTVTTLHDAEQALIDDFALLGEWTDRYEYIIGLGRALPPFPESLRTEANEVHGCQSQVWLAAHRQNDRLYFDADSDALITKGLVALLVQLYSGRTPAEIRGATLDVLRGVGLASHLTPSRVNGLHAMFKRIRRYAVEAESGVQRNGEHKEGKEWGS